MKTIVLLLTICLALASARRFSENEYKFFFQDFVTRYEKNYVHEEQFHKYMTFKDNLDFIIEENEKGHSYTLGINEYADLTWREFKEQKVGLDRHLLQARPKNYVTLNVNAPDEKNWVGTAVTSVKNQRQCGSCYSFSGTAAIEGACLVKYPVKDIESMTLAPQEAVDCSGSYGNQGCSGGWMDNVFQYAQANNGLCKWKDYPYMGKEGTCQSAKCQHFCAVSGYVDVPQNNEDQLKQALSQQPVSVAVQADQQSFQFYKKGVLMEKCGTELDHGVLLAGYGVEDNVPYWLIKNSWGDGWGDKGYIKILRGTGSGNPGLCGVAMAASYPIAK